MSLTNIMNESCHNTIKALINKKKKLSILYIIYNAITELTLKRDDSKNFETINCIYL